MTMKKMRVSVDLTHWLPLSLTCHQQLDCHHVHATLVLSPVNNYCTQKKDGEMVYLLIFHVPFRFLHSFLTAKEAVQQSIRSICVFV